MYVTHTHTPDETVNCHLNLIACCFSRFAVVAAIIVTTCNPDPCPPCPSPLLSLPLKILITAPQDTTATTKVNPVFPPVYSFIQCYFCCQLLIAWLYKNNNIERHSLGCSLSLSLSLSLCLLLFLFLYLFAWQLCSI